eukprot:CAMPEP_0182808480 /NCGR_PEP_ID=MMETSP0006_2-20121128/6671_1 /TAXON_ID=97485 /ORGANISM="Prymnesium parvum, Strain Texoma1" /LENGTH=124 /DNA_ID=CAMNT_0024934197 /DNA_START=364 /DNA_END=738 /DNA_ORIENTATION=+
MSVHSEAAHQVVAVLQQVRLEQREHPPVVRAEALARREVAAREQAKAGASQPGGAHFHSVGPRADDGPADVPSVCWADDELPEAVGGGGGGGGGGGDGGGAREGSEERRAKIAEWNKARDQGPQ